MEELGFRSEDHIHYHGVDKAEEHLSVANALKLLLESIRPPKSEVISLQLANNRILIEGVKSPTNLPKLARSTRDGYAVNIAKDEKPGKSFLLTGDVRIGAIPKLWVKKGEAVRVATGSYIPHGANSVVMLEYVDAKHNLITTEKQVKIGENILDAGGDFTKGQILLGRGTRIMPQHIALFSMLGIRKVKVFSRPRIAVFSTGDELVDVRESNEKNSHLIYDANRPFINSMVTNLGGRVVDLGIAKDEFKGIKVKLLKGLKCDGVILSAGSSVGERDYVSKVIDSISGIRMLVHGVAMRPSSPTGLATYRGKPIILLPGFPTSTIVSFLVFAKPAILALSGSSATKPLTIRGRLLEEYKGKEGITHFVRVNVKREGDAYIANIMKPTEAYSSRWLQSGNGVAVISQERGPVRANDEVDIFVIGDISDAV